MVPDIAAVWNAEPWDAVVSDLEKAQSSLLNRVVRHVRDVFPTYSAVSGDQLTRSFRQNMDMCVRAVTDDGPPGEDQLRSYAQIARRRFESGVPIDDLIRSYRFSIGLIADELTDLLAEHRGSPRGGVYAYRRIWSVTDVYTALLAEVYRQHRLQTDTHNHELKMDFIERLRAGTVDESSLGAARVRFRLDGSVDYRAFIARLTADSEHDLYALMVMLESQLVGRQGLGVIRGGAIIGICAQPFTAVPPLSLSYGHAVRLEEVSASFDSAERVAATSIAQSPGNHYIADAAWRISVDPAAPLLDHFEQRYVVPLASSRVSAETILDSVEHFLLHNRSYRKASAALHCHQNTLRYRIARFEEIAGVRLEDTETVVSLQWMFEARVRTATQTASARVADAERQSL